MLVPASSKTIVLSVRGLTKSYGSNVHALRGIDIDVREGEFLVILGPSGAGKSTLMRCVNRLVEPTDGKIIHDGQEITSKSRSLRAVRRQFGMAFQRADTLSGGEQQRVAIARALAQQPTIILADEPVASLDPKIARQVLTYLKQVSRELGITVLCNLHQVEYTREFAERIVGMSRGKVVFEGTAADLTEEILHRIYYRDPDEQDDKHE